MPSCSAVISVRPSALSGGNERNIRFGCCTPRGFTLHIKNGWAPLPFVSSPWWVNSTGAFTNANAARDYTIVILTRGNADETTGVVTIEDIAGSINRTLAGAGAQVGPAHTKPYPSWNIPDEPIPPVPAR